MYKILMNLIIQPLEMLDILHFHQSLLKILMKKSISINHPDPMPESMHKWLMTATLANIATVNETKDEETGELVGKLMETLLKLPFKFHY